MGHSDGIDRRLPMASFETAAIGGISGIRLATQLVCGLRSKNRRRKKEDNDIHLVSLQDFSRGKNIEVRKVISLRKTRKIQDIEAYSKEVIGMKNYSFQDNNCLDLVNRLTLKI